MGINKLKAKIKQEKKASKVVVETEEVVTAPVTKMPKTTKDAMIKISKIEVLTWF